MNPCYPWILCTVRYNVEKAPTSRPILYIDAVFPVSGFPVLMMRQLGDHLIFIMGIPILINEHLYIESAPGSTLQWHHNGHDSISNHQPYDFLLNRLFRRRSKKTSKLCATGLCARISPGTVEFPAQMASYAKNVTIWWRHHESICWWWWHTFGEHLKMLTITLATYCCCLLKHIANQVFLALLLPKYATWYC